MVKNTAVHSVKNIPSFFAGSTFYTGGAGGLSGIYYKPVMPTTFALIYSIFGGRAFFFHLFQLLLHIINAILVFFLFRHLFSEKREWLAFFLALIFLVHPINTEAVVYASALQEVLFFFFGMVALLFYIKTDPVTSFPHHLRSKSFGDQAASLGAARPSKRKRSGVGALPLVPPVFILLSLLSKETGIVFFAIVFFYLLLFKKERLFVYSVFSFLTLCFYAVLRFGLAGVYFTRVGLSPIMRASLAERLLTLPKMIFYYLKTFFYPVDLAIAQHWVVKTANLADFYLPLLFVGLFFVVIFFIFLAIKPRFDRDKPYNHLPASRHGSAIKFIFFLLWFVFGLGLHLQIFPLDMTVADRWFYLPIVGLLGMMGVILSRQRKFLSEVNSPPTSNVGPLAPPSTSKIEDSAVAHWLKQLIHRKNFVAFLKYWCVSLIIIFLSIRTIVRTFDWRDGLTLFSRDIKISKDSFDLQNNLGVELFRKGKVEEAKIHFEKSTDLAPYWWTNWNNLAVVYERYGDFKKAEGYYKKAIDNGDYYLAYENYVGILIKEGKKDEAKEFLEKKALLKFPYNQKLSAFYKYLIAK